MHLRVERRYPKRAERTLPLVKRNNDLRWGRTNPPFVNRCFLHPRRQSPEKNKPLPPPPGLAWFPRCGAPFEYRSVEGQGGSPQPAALLGESRDELRPLPAAGGRSSFSFSFGPFSSSFASIRPGSSSKRLRSIGSVTNYRSQDLLLVTEGSPKFVGMLAVRASAEANSPPPRWPPSPWPWPFPSLWTSCLWARA